MKDPLTQQVKRGPAVSLSLDQLKASDLAFSLSLRLREIQASTNGCLISSESTSETSQLWFFALQRPVHPGRELGSCSVSHQMKEGLGQMIDVSTFVVSLSQAFKVFLLFLREPAHW